MKRPAASKAKHKRGKAATFLRRFVYLMARDQNKLLASERDALVNKMAALANCAASCLRYDVERVAQERDRQAECEHLERITGMVDSAEPEDEP